MSEEEECDGLHRLCGHLTSAQTREKVHLNHVRVHFAFKCYYQNENCDHPDCPRTRCTCYLTLLSVSGLWQCYVVHTRVASQPHTASYKGKSSSAICAIGVTCSLSRISLYGVRDTCKMYTNYRVQLFFFIVFMQTFP